MGKKIYRKAKIAKCSNPDFWYQNRIGLPVMVIDWPSAYVEDNRGRSILRHDIKEL